MLLYVEDNEDNLYMLQLRFDVLGGYEVLSARNASAGIAMAASERPDLILMDLDLPGIDGWEATRRLKANPATRDIPIIALRLAPVPQPISTTRSPCRSCARSSVACRIGPMTRSRDCWRSTQWRPPALFQ
jgi:response regulator RpfG family c-di-GMP phosphodiesterase